MLKRAYEKIRDKYFLSKYTNKVEECLYTYNLEKREIKKVLFYFPKYEYMHLGDHLFFEPLMNQLVKDGYEVSVFPAKIMEFYFKNLGYRVISELEEDIDLIITRTEFIKEIKKLKNVLLYEYLNTNLNEKLCVDIVKKVYKVIDSTKIIDSLSIKIQYLKLDKELQKEIQNKYNILQDNKYIIFNNYLDSGKFLNIFSNYNKKFEIKLKDLKKQGYYVIHVGSKKDKEKDRKIYNFVDIDLRGKTSVEELFYLIDLDNIKVNVGFDAFIMHLFFIKNKKNYIFIRNKITSKRKECIKKYFNPPLYIKEVLSYL